MDWGRKRLPVLVAVTDIVCVCVCVCNVVQMVLPPSLFPPNNCGAAADEAAASRVEVLLWKTS